MSKNAWLRVMQNVKLSAKYGAAGGRTVTLLQEAGLTEKEISEKISNNYSGNKTIEIDEDYLRKLFYEQDERCYWLGTKINESDVFIPHHPLAPSVDRLDNDFGYIPKNVVITTRFANRGRCTVEDTFFLDMCLPRIKNDIEFARTEINQYDIGIKRTNLSNFYEG